MKELLGLAVALTLIPSVVSAEDAKSECLSVGSDVGAFYVTDVTGPNAGNQLCYRCQYKDRPVVSVFAREVNGELATLVKRIDDLVAQHSDEKMAAFVVVLSDDPKSQEGKLKELAKAHGLKNTPLTTFDDKQGPPSYKVSKDADFTVMMWVNGALKVNESFKKGELNNQSITTVTTKTDEILN